MLRWRGRRKCHTRGALKAMREPHARGRVWGRSKRDGGRAGGASRRARCGARKRARPHHARVQGEELWVAILRGVSPSFKPQVIEHAAVAQIVRNLAPVANLRAFSIRPRVPEGAIVGALIFTVGAGGVRDRLFRLGI